MEHFALLNLMRTTNYVSDIRWMGRRLGISSVVVRAALERMERLGQVRRVNKKWERTANPLTTSHNVPSVALRKSHRQSIEHAMTAMEQVPVDLRDITSVTMIMDPTMMKEAKDLIKDFRRSFAKIAEGRKNLTEVYNLNVQLVPVTKVVS